MRFVALLRGINVGGRAKVEMKQLRKAFEDEGFSDVTTYINSGNVIFTSGKKDIQKLERDIEETVRQVFKLDVAVVVRAESDIKKIFAKVPENWKFGEELRCYVAFLKSPATTKDVISQVTLREGIDSIDVGSSVVYMTTLLSGITKSGFSKLTSKPIYKLLTIRNYNTVRKVVELMEKKQ